MGEQVTLQNLVTKLWDIPAQIISCRTAPDGKVLSYELRQHNGTVTTRHRVFIRPSLPEANDVVEGEAEVDFWDFFKFNFFGQPRAPMFVWKTLIC